MKKLYILFALSFVFSFKGMAQPTYKDVAGIFYKRCTSCHHTDGGAPFSMMNYAETAPYAAAIKNDLNSGKMPPWPPDTTYTRFLHERIITASEKKAIIDWVDGGVLEGDPNLVPTPPVYGGYKIKSKPDLILKVPGFKSNGGTDDVYNCFVLPTGLNSTRYIRAFEIVPNNKNLVHHVVVSVDTTGTKTSDTGGACFSQPGQLGMGGYTPGCVPSIYPNSSQIRAGMPIKPGWKIAMQQHYPGGTAGLVDSTELRLYLYPEGTTGIRQMYANTLVQYWGLFPSIPTIPANQVSSFNGQSAAFTTAVSMYGEYPHAHKVNKSMRINATNGTDSIRLIQILNWDFNWEGVYVHKKMLKVPAGYKLSAKHVYDNTTNNPNNPNNPPKMLAFNYHTSDEMLFDSFEWLTYQAGDENIDIEEILSNDPLIVTSTDANPVSVQTIDSYVYPNPVSDAATLVITNQKAANCQVKLFDAFGKEVSAVITRSSDVFQINRGNLAAGLYYYTVTSDNYSGSGKFMVMPQNTK